MILAIDVGNTNIVLGCLHDAKPVFVERLFSDRGKTEHEYAVEIKNLIEMNGLHRTDISGAIISSVVPQLTASVRTAAEKILGVEVLSVSTELNTGIVIASEDPRQVGSDLIAGAAAVCAEYGAPAVIVDMGTATTISVLDSSCCFTGCVIMSGVRTALDALIDRAALLQDVEITAPPRVLAADTAGCMQSGAVYGSAAAIDGIIERIEAELGEPMQAIATGGLARRIIPYCRRRVLLDEDLLLKGLAHIYRLNRP